MGRKGSKKTAEIIQRLVDLGTAELVEQLAIPEAQARILMRQVGHLFARECGGGAIYLTKDRDFALTKRDLDLFARMASGPGTTEVAREFGITARQVQIIAKHVREQGGGRIRQNSLPGFDQD